MLWKRKLYCNASKETGTHLCIQTNQNKKTPASSTFSHVLKMYSCNEDTEKQRALDVICETHSQSINFATRSRELHAHSRLATGPRCDCASCAGPAQSCTRSNSDSPSCKHWKRLSCVGKSAVVQLVTGISHPGRALSCM